jgi:TusA-related sulfurtransferase
MSHDTMTVPITAGDTVSDVLARSESLVDVFVRHAPHFAKLRNRAMRRIMARLVTVEQAARTANVSPERLVHDLNEALGISDPADVVQRVPETSTASADLARHPDNANVVELDVREDLRAGREPFSKIMLAVAQLGADDVLRLRTIFEPAPLFGVLAKRGFAHESTAHAADDWSAWFWRSDGRNDATAAPASDRTDRSRDVAVDPASVADSDATVVLDVRGLQPPEPLMRTLAALETLPEGHVLVQINSRVPQLLFPMLAEQGYACEVDESRAEEVLVRIWRQR